MVDWMRLMQQPAAAEISLFITDRFAITRNEVLGRHELKGGAPPLIICGQEVYHPAVAAAATRDSLSDMCAHNSAFLSLPCNKCLQQHCSLWDRCIYSARRKKITKGGLRKIKTVKDFLYI